MSRESLLRGNRHRGKVHACYVATLDSSNESFQFVHPLFAFVDRPAIVEDSTTFLPRESAKQLASEYNERVLGLSPGRAQAIIAAAKRLSHLPYPKNYETTPEFYDRACGAIERIDVASIAIHDTDPAAGLESRVSSPATGILLAFLLSAVFWASLGLILWWRGII
jgi:hypothetical protein